MRKSITNELDRVAGMLLSVFSDWDPYGYADYRDTADAEDVIADLQTEEGCEGWLEFLDDIISECDEEISDVELDDMIYNEYAEMYDRAIEIQNLIKHLGRTYYEDIYQG